MKYKLARLFYPYGACRKVLRGPLRGYKFHVAPGYGLTYAFGSSALHLDALDQLVSPGMTVFDIGANRGLISLLFSHRAGERGQVVAFEPITELNHDFAANMTLNQVGNVTLVQAAVSQSEGEMLMEYSPEHSTQGKFQTAEPGLKVSGAHPLKVRTVALDNYVETEKVQPDFMKIDVEGAAGFVFSGARKVLSQMLRRFLSSCMVRKNRHQWIKLCKSMVTRFTTQKGRLLKVSCVAGIVRLSVVLNDGFL